MFANIFFYIIFIKHKYFNPSEIFKNISNDLLFNGSKMEKCLNWHLPDRVKFLLRLLTLKSLTYLNNRLCILHEYTVKWG